MLQLKSSLTPSLLVTLIQDIVSGSTANYAFLNDDSSAFVSTHEVIFDSDKEIVDFATDTKTILSSFFNKDVPAGRINNNSEASYTTFISLFTTQAGIVRIVWLNGKILSMLIGSKPLIVLPVKEGNKAVVPTKFAAYYFGFSEDSVAGKALTDTDKEALMNIPSSAWLVSKHRYGSGAIPNNPDSSKSFSVAEGYIRHGSIEKVSGIDDLFLLSYPKPNSNLFQSGGSWGSGLPALSRIMANFEYFDLIETPLVCSGEWSRWRDSENSLFLVKPDLDELLNNNKYYRFSFKTMTKFEALKRGAKDRDTISKKYGVFTEEDQKKYYDNPRYDVIFSEDKSMFFVAKSDKLKATALQTKITKSLREDFIEFLNWIGYFQFTADLEPGLLADSFISSKLVQAASVSWLDNVEDLLKSKQSNLLTGATECFRSLYMNETSGTITPLQNDHVFQSVFGKFMQASSYNRGPGDPIRLLRSNNRMLTFNKKFSLDVNLPASMLNFIRGVDIGNIYDSNRIYFKAEHDVSSFLSGNFLLSDETEQEIERVLKGYTEVVNNQKSIASWHLEYSDTLKKTQLLKTCVTLSPEALAIFNSVATLTSPTDILSWLELSKDHFTKTLPEQLTSKFGSRIASKQRIASLINTGIEYYMTILSAAEPFSNKLLNVSDDTGE